MYDVRRPMTDPLNILQVNVRDRSCAVCPIGAVGYEDTYVIARSRCGACPIGALGYRKLGLRMKHRHVWPVFHVSYRLC